MYYLYSKEINNNVYIIPNKNIILKHKLLKLAKYVIFPSKYIANVYIDIIGPYNNMHIIPHNDNCTYNKELYIPKVDNIIKIGIITNINIIKGYDYYKILCNINKYKEYTIHYYIFGFVKNKDILINKYIHHNGPYNENEIYDIIKTNNIYGLMFLNKHPETYCYALSKGINMRLPILYTDIGAVGERLSSYNDEKYHIYTNINSYYKFIDYIIYNNGTGNWKDINMEININKFYIDLFCPL